MKYVRKLVKNGHSTQITLTPKLLAFLRWQTGDPMVVELSERGTVEIRRAVPADFNGAHVSDMTLDNTIPASLR